MFKSFCKEELCSHTSSNQILIFQSDFEHMQGAGGAGPGHGTQAPIGCLLFKNSLNIQHGFIFKIGLKMDRIFKHLLNNGPIFKHMFENGPYLAHPFFKQAIRLVFQTFTI